MFWKHSVLFKSFTPDITAVVEPDKWNILGSKFIGNLSTNRETHGQQLFSIAEKKP